MTSGSDDGRARLAALGGERFVSLTTFRRNGQGVATPVWIAADGDALIVITPQESHKVGRIRRDPRVTLVACGRTGKVRPGGEPVSAVAAVVAGPAEVARLREIIRRKYGLEFRLIMAAERLLARRQKPRVILRLTAPAS